MCVWINLIKSTFKGKLFSATLLQVPKSLTKKRRMIFFSVVGTHRDRTKKFLKADCDFSRHVSQKTYDVTKGKWRHTQTTSKKRRLKKRRSSKTSFFICQEFSWFSEKIGKSTLKVINFYFYINVWIRFLTLTRKEIKWDPRKDGLKNFRKNLLFYLFCFFCEERNWRWGSIIQWVAADWCNGVNLLLSESTAMQS